MSTPNNNTLVNVTDLFPGTRYNLTVVAVIEAGEVVARSIEGAPLTSITTGFTGKSVTFYGVLTLNFCDFCAHGTVPQVVCPRPESNNGIITASWSYVHTGGLPLTGLSVMYSYEEGVSTITRSVSVSLDDFMVSVSGLVAGEEYTFTVTAENMNGSSSTVCEPVDHIIGKYTYYSSSIIISLLPFSHSLSLAGLSISLPPPSLSLSPSHNHVLCY